MWARAQAANEIIDLLSKQESEILDIQRRIAQIELENVKITPNP